ncbi:MAG: oxygen-independent coproporphyrinogen III oxidase [Tannerellaceae bacterium]|nr:oxygen-independent coproporphyrinogen III oxidase [Tannerellaceae bacterium]
MKPEELIQKYNVPVPRYTSYPPANYFTDQVGNLHYEEAIEASNHESPRHLSFYIHIPFCRHLCHYCGCNSIGISGPEVIARYVAALHTEIDRVVGRLDKSRCISQIHYGGGSPTILPADELRKLNEHLLSSFPSIEEPEIAIECHPGYLDRQAWEALTKAGFNRFSIGVQDFEPAVLKAVNRRPSLLPMEEIVDLLRAASAHINLDLLYGLPLQTVESFSRTVEKAALLAPDRLVTFSYGHVPWVNPRQCILEKTGFPTGEEKKKMYETAVGLLKHYEYKTIGLDHFVKEEDELYLSLQQKMLSRNFQGYCSLRTTGQVYAFGMTGISQLNGAYIQNSKDLFTYIHAIENGTFAVERGYVLNREQQITRLVIQTLMCNYFLDMEEIAAKVGLPLHAVKSCTAWNDAKLQQFAADNIIEYTNHTIRITPQGTLFVRNVAASLDKLMQESVKSYSKPV